MAPANSSNFDPSRLFGRLGADGFFRDHWQRRMLSLELDADIFSAIGEMIGELTIAHLARSARSGTQAWIATEHIAHSVITVDPAGAEDFFKIGATLYFLDVPLPGLTSALADFLGAPRDRVIASFFLTPPQGGAAAHFDANENFTIQLTGAKRWFVADAPVVASAPAGLVLGEDVPPALMPLVGPSLEPGAGQSVTLRPGSLLYVPRGTIHYTEAGTESWSLNLSYAHTMWMEVVGNALRRRLASSEQWRSTVTGLGGSCHPAARAGNIFPHLAAELRQILSNPHELEQLCRDFLAQPDS
jgi:ribosomal protein L16 Arg81 hydroxylase